MINFVLLIIAFIFYYLAYRSPKTDLILYAFSGIFLLLAGATGLMGYGDVQVGEQISYTYTTVGNSTVVDTQTHTPVYSDSKVFNTYVPIIEILVGLYLLIVLAVNPGKENERNE